MFKLKVKSFGVIHTFNALTGDEAIDKAEEIRKLDKDAKILIENLTTGELISL